MSSRYLDPRIDLAFKRVFGEHADLLKSFLNALLPLPADAPIESLEYLASEQVPEVPGLAKTSIVDVKCKDTQGRTFIVEMQMLWSASFMQRMLFSASQAYVKQLYKGQNYTHLQPVYALAISNEIFDHDTANFHHHYQIVNLQNPARVLEGLEFVFIELPKFKPQNATDRRVVKWLRFLSEVGENDASFIADWRDDKEIQAALELVEAGAFTEAQLESYHSGLDAARLEATLIADATAKGKAEATAELIQALHASGMSAAQISVNTRLSLAMVEKMLALPKT